MRRQSVSCFNIQKNPADYKPARGFFGQGSHLKFLNSVFDEASVESEVMPSGPAFDGCVLPDQEGPEAISLVLAEQSNVPESAQEFFRRTRRKS
jgi:hypothetical protein